MSFPKPQLFSKPHRRISEICKIFDYPARIAILQELMESGDLCVFELAQRIPLRQPTISKHLRILRKAHIVNVEVLGAYNKYSIAPEVFSALVNEVNVLLNDMPITISKKNETSDNRFSAKSPLAL